MNKVLYILLVLSSIIMVSSCNNDDSVSSGVPVISAVVNITKTDTLTESALDSWIRIEGQNFCNVTDIQFNDISVAINDAYITSDEITVQIPRKIAEEVSNKVTVVTNDGVATYDFNIVYPELVVTGMVNEFTATGEQLVVKGEYFDLYGIDSTSTITFGNIEVSLDRATADSLYVTVPEGIAAGSEVKIHYGTDKIAKIPGLYKDNRSYQINTFDYVNNIQWTHTDLIVGPDTTSIAGKYFHFKGNIKFEYLIHFGPGESVPDDVFKNAADYCFKFEVRTLQPMAKTGFQFIFSASPSNVEYDWYPNKSGAPLDTKGNWKTITIGLENWEYVPGMGQWMYFNLSGEDTEELVDLCLDNFRIVPKN